MEPTETIDTSQRADTLDIEVSDARGALPDARRLWALPQRQQDRDFTRLTPVDKGVK